MTARPVPDARTRLLRLAASVVLVLPLLACECKDETLNQLAGGIAQDFDSFTKKSTTLEASFADSEQASDWEMSVNDYAAVKHGDLSGGNDEYYLVNYASELVPGFQMQNVLKVPADDTRSYQERTQGLFELHTDMMLDRVPDKDGFMRFWAAQFPDRPIANISENVDGSGGATRTFHMTAPKGGVKSQEELEAKKGPTVAYDEKAGWKVLDPGE